MVFEGLSLKKDGVSIFGRGGLHLLVNDSGSVTDGGLLLINQRC